MTRLPVASEDAEQAALFSWADIAAWGEPRALPLALMFAVPNGGHRHPATAARLKATGVRAGVPDVCLPVRSADGAFIGLWLELKRADGGRVSKAQTWWHGELRAAGHRVEVARGWQAAAEVVCEHLGLPGRLTPWVGGTE